MLRLKDTISQSEIIFAIVGEPPNFDPAASAAGIRAHKEIIGQARQGMIPDGLRRAGVGKNLTGEKTYRRDIGDGLHLTARVDIATDNLCVDLKPGREVKGRHLLQPVISCIARNQPGVGAVLHLYQNGESYLIEGISEKTEEKIIQIARDSRIILDNQERIKTGGLSKGERYNLGVQSTAIRKRLDANTGEVMAEIIKTKRRV